MACDPVDPPPPRQPGISRQFNALLDAIPDTLVYLSPALEVVWANLAAAEKLGLGLDDVVGRRCHELWHCRETPCPVCPVQSTLATGRPETREVVDPAGTVWDLRSVAVRAEDGSVAGAIELARDITAQRRLEEQLGHARRLEAVGRLAGRIAHDFNNYLAAISGFADLAMLELPPDAPGRGSVEQIHAAALAAGGVTRQLLSFSRRQPPATQPIDVGALIRRLEGMLRQLAGEECRLELLLPAALGAVVADPGQVEQALVNLVVNAREAMPRGGTILVAAGERDLAAPLPAHPGPIGPGPYVVLTVRDTGHGVGEEARAHIFEPFYTTKETGTGLGLATVADLAVRAGGGVRLVSAPAGGTCIEVLLPRAPATAAVSAVAAPETAARPEGPRLTILLAEDQAPVRAAVARILRRQGHAVLEAADGAAALEVEAAHPGPIDLLLTDVVMPGMRGAELARRLRQARPGAAVLFMSGYSPDERDSGETPPRVALRKPFTAETLARAVRAATGPGAAPAG